MNWSSKTKCRGFQKRITLKFVELYRAYRTLLLQLSFLYVASFNYAKRNNSLANKTPSCINCFISYIEHFDDCYIRSNAIDTEFDQVFTSRECEHLIEFDPAVTKHYEVIGITINQMRIHINANIQDIGSYIPIFSLKVG